jgi:hypothetical protein
MSKTARNKPRGKVQNNSLKLPKQCQHCIKCLENITFFFFMLCLGFLALYIMPRDCTQHLISYTASKTLACMLGHTLSYFHTIKNATSNHYLSHSPSLTFSCKLTLLQHYFSHTLSMSFLFIT